jgi:hypothetical protein
VRLLVPLLTIFACGGTYWLGLQASSRVAGDSSLVMVVVVPLAIVVALGVAALSERLLKRHWPSGRSLTVDEAGLTLRERNRSEVALRWDRHINVLAWRFTVPPRRGRVPKGWLCVACQLLQDEQAMSLYSFFPPKEAEALPQFPAFTPLIARKKLVTGPGDKLRRGRQDRLHSAEAERWDCGAELTSEDFVALVRVMGEHIGGWPMGESGRYPAPADVERTRRPPSKGAGKPIKL